MRVSVETTSGLERKLTVGVPADDVDSAVDKKLADAAKNVRLPGFRPGKVPMRVMNSALVLAFVKRYLATWSTDLSKRRLWAKSTSSRPTKH